MTTGVVEKILVGMGVGLVVSVGVILYKIVRYLIKRSPYD